LQSIRDRLCHDGIEGAAQLRAERPMLLGQPRQLRIGGDFRLHCG
jgi:hypothetical protein